MLLDQEFWKRQAEGQSEEEELVRVIHGDLLTEGQALWLVQQKLTINNLVNNRYPVSLTDEVEAIFDDWNQKLGRYTFGYSLGEKRGMPYHDYGIKAGDTIYVKYLGPSAQMLVHAISGPLAALADLEQKKHRMWLPLEDLTPVGTQEPTVCSPENSSSS